MNPATLTTEHVHAGQARHLDPAHGERLLRLGHAAATLNPSADLQRPRVHGDRQGRCFGAKDIAGNALAADVSWSFTTQGGSRPRHEPAT